MTIKKDLLERNQHKCELCNEEDVRHSYVVSPRKEGLLQNMVGLCDTCFSDIDSLKQLNHWRCLEGSVWSTVPSVQALSYRLLQRLADEQWAQDTMSSADPGEEIIDWASYRKAGDIVHIDGFGNVLQNGDNVLLTQALDVKGSNFTASKGTVVKRIRLVNENADQIEGKINEQQIVILTKYVKKTDYNAAVRFRPLK